MLFFIFSGFVGGMFTLDESMVRVEKLEGYDLFRIKGFGFLTDTGKPMLPAKVISFVIPPDARVEDIEIETSGVYVLGKYTPYPAQPPVPISFPVKRRFVSPDPEVYEGKKAYPENVVELVHTGNISGYKIVSLRICPLRYVGGKIKVYPEIRYRIVYREGVITPRKVTKRQREAFGRVVRSLVVNREDVKSFAPPVR
ncbi:hypothetical protein DRQ18_00320 [bacterium]|nr:MAG: hypothetical protein DRQ18_00320 [bacterium]